VHEIRGGGGNVRDKGPGQRLKTSNRILPHRRKKKGWALKVVVKKEGRRRRSNRVT